MRKQAKRPSFCPFSLVGTLDTVQSWARYRRHLRYGSPGTLRKVATKFIISGVQPPRAPPNHIADLTDRQADRDRAVVKGPSSPPPLSRVPPTCGLFPVSVSTLLRTSLTLGFAPHLSAYCALKIFCQKIRAKCANEERMRRTSFFSFTSFLSPSLPPSPLHS